MAKNRPLEHINLRLNCQLWLAKLFYLRINASILK